MNKRTASAVFGLLFTLVALSYIGGAKAVNSFLNFMLALWPAAWEYFIKDEIIQRIIYIVLIALVNAFGIFLTKKTEKKVFVIIGGIMGIAGIASLMNTYR